MNNELLTIGDEVIINIPNENWDWGYRPVNKQCGEIGVVKGFGEIAYGRVNNFGYEAGIYQNRHWIYVSVNNQKPFSISSCFIETDKKKYDINKKEDRFITELPETKFWEGDIVTVNGRYSEIMIIGIEYQDYPISYRISDNFNVGWYTSAKEQDMTLVRRGNVWKYYHNEDIKFNNIEEESNFYKLLGQYDEVKNPNTNNYAWTKDEVLEAIKNGIVDGFTMSNSWISAVKFHNRDLGVRLQKATLKGFKIE